MKCWECKKNVGLQVRHIDGETLCHECFIDRCAAHVADDLEAKMLARNGRVQTEAELEQDAEDAQTIARALVSRQTADA
jgi:hypothetical protein